MKPLDYKLAFIVAYRNRGQHLIRFIPHYRNLFPNADIYIIQQLGDAPFNKGSLLNIGFMYAEQKADAFDVADIDMLAVDGEVDFSFPKVATHLATAASQFNYRMPYPTYFSGHVLLTAEHMRSVNGYYNDYPGYGCEDDCFYRSFIDRGLPIERRYGKFESLPHERVVEKDPAIMALYDRNWEILKKPRDYTNGLTSCQYTIRKVHNFKDYTRIDINL